MKNTGGPVKEFPVAEKALQDFNQLTAPPLPDFSDTALTFSHLSDKRLLGTRRLFRLMGNPYLTRLMGSLGVKAIGWSLPGAEWIVRNTVYKQFVGGTHLEDTHATIAQLAQRGVYSILDFGAEGKATQEGMDESLAEALRGTNFASTTEAVIGTVVKLTSLFPYALLEEYNDKTIDFQRLPEEAFKRGFDRLDRICRLGRERGCEVYLDAEESWIQTAIDQLAEEMMSRYNREKPIVFTTCQFYRHDRLDYMRTLHLRARQSGFKLALKLVRGAYMTQEAKRMEKTGRPSPIQPNLEATHRDFNAGAAYCLEHRDEIAYCIASHNEASTVRHIAEMKRLGVPRNHPNIRFSQLLGMSDNLTFNLAEGGYNVSKYMVYGPVKEVLPYLVRRAQENTSVTGEAGRELRMLEEEVKRRGL